MLPVLHVADTARTNDEGVDEVDPRIHFVKEFNTFVISYLST